MIKKVILLLLVTFFCTSQLYAIDETRTWTINSTTTDTIKSQENNTNILEEFKDNVIIDSVKKKQESLQNLLDPTTEEKEQDSLQKDSITLDVKDSILSQINDSLKSDITQLETYIKDNEALKLKLLLAENKTEEDTKKIESLTESIKNLKESLSQKTLQYNSILPEQKAEIELLKTENTLLSEKLATTIQDKLKIESKDFNIKFYILLSVYWFFLLLRIWIAIFKSYYPEEYKNYSDKLIIAYIYSWIFLIWFTIVMIFVFNSWLLVSLLFLGSAILITMKDFITSLLLSTSSSRSFKVWGYITFDWKVWVVSDIWFWSITLRLIDENGDSNWEILKIPHKFLNEKVLTFNKKFKVERKIEIDDLEKYKWGIEKLEEVFKTIFEKYKVGYSITNTYKNNVIWIIVKWEENKKLKDLLDSELYLQLDDLKLEEIVLELKDLSFVKESKFNYDIIYKKDHFVVTFKILKKEKKDFIKFKNSFNINLK